MFFAFLGKLLFPRQPEWERQRNAKLLTITLIFSLGLGLFLIKLIPLISATHH
jgi:hypothetical protein